MFGPVASVGACTEQPVEAEPFPTGEDGADLGGDSEDVLMRNADSFKATRLLYTLRQRVSNYAYDQLPLCLARPRRAPSRRPAPRQQPIP
jgi:hypothetical protein